MSVTDQQQTQSMTAALPEGLKALLSRAGDARHAPPVEKWDPPFCGDLDMEIHRDGSWSYMGSAISREALVKLFASVLRRDGDQYFLVTPVEKVGLRVEDAPFVAVEMNIAMGDDGQVITLRTNVGDVIEVNSEHPLRFGFHPENDGLKPYVLVRGALEALFARPLIYELAEHLEERIVDGECMVGLSSHGTFFVIGPAHSVLGE